MSRRAPFKAPQGRRAARLAVSLGLGLALLGGCVAGGVGVGVDEGYWGEPSFDYDMDFGAPYGFDEPWGYGGYGGYGYGGWGPGYLVGPPAWGHRGSPGRGGPAMHEPPSIPIGARGPGMRGGGLRR